MSKIVFTTAPIGGGKSLWAVINMMETLINTNRGIVTNVPLILQLSDDGFRKQRLFDLLADKGSVIKAKDYWTVSEFCDAYAKNSVDVRRRLVVLEGVQAMEFWRYLPPYITNDEIFERYNLELIENSSDPERQCKLIKLPLRKDAIAGTCTDYLFRTENKYGIDYHIDEAHIMFPARAWQKIGTDIEQYQSQLRKQDDNLYFYSQHPEKVEKNLRRNATGWCQVQNLGKKKMFLGVSLPGRFQYWYYDQPDMPGRGDKPTTRSTYSFDKRRRYQYLYRTMMGVGMTGGAVAETQPKSRHWAVWLLALIGAVLFGMYVPRILQGMFENVIRGVLHGTQAGIENGMRGTVGAVNTAVVQPSSPPPVRAITQPFLTPPSGLQAAILQQRHLQENDGVAPFHATGVMRIGTNVWVFLSDGRICKSENGDVQGYGEHFVRVLGNPEKIPIQQ